MHGGCTAHRRRLLVSLRVGSARLLESFLQGLTHTGTICRQHERPTGELPSLRVYEAHVGMSSEEPKVASYAEFKGEYKLQICDCTRQRHDCTCCIPAKGSTHLQLACRKTPTFQNVNTLCACRQCAAAYCKAGIQCHPADGSSRACILRLVWISCDKSLCSLIPLRQPRDAQGEHKGPCPLLLGLTCKVERTAMRVSP